MTVNPLDNHPSGEHHQADIQPNKNGRADVIQWQCMNCGQHIFAMTGTEPPDTCEYCQDMTTWQSINDS